MKSSEGREDPTYTAGAPLADPGIIKHYHAHIYYDPVSSRDRAARLRERVAAAFPEATLGRWHDALVGPHPQSMYQVAFPRALLASFLPWLMLNRDGLTILLHPGTGDAYADHTDHAVWLGGTLPLRPLRTGERGMRYAGRQQAEPRRVNGGIAAQCEPIVESTHRL